MSQALNSIRRNAASDNNASNGGGVVLNFPALLERSKGEIARALPKHLDPDRIARIALTVFRTTPALHKCKPVSVLAAVIQASQLGLEIGQNGEAHLVPFKDECQMIPGYLGLIKLARNSGMVKDVYAHEVYENDHFALRLGLDRHLEHEPLTARGGFPASAKERGAVVGFYAVAVFKDGSNTFVAMGVDEINQIRDASRGYQASKRFGKQSPWDTDYVPMGKKTVIRALCKMLPKSSEMSVALGLDQAAEAGRSQGIKLQEAADGSYEPPVIDEGVDMETGEIQQPTQAAPAIENEPSEFAGFVPPVTQREKVVAQQNDSQDAPRAAVKEVKPANTARQSSKIKETVSSMESAKDINELNELYIRAEMTFEGADLETMVRAYNAAKDRLDGKTSGDMFS
jgi:recombination protein RecT